MTESDRGQVIVIVAVVLVVFLLFLAVLIDGARLLVEKHEINRALDAAGKAGLIVIGDHMLTQLAATQSAAVTTTSHAVSSGNSPQTLPSQTPAPEDFYPWLTEDDRQTLVAPAMQTVVATHVLGSLEENGFGLNDPDLIQFTITYPDLRHPDDQALGILLKLDWRVSFIFDEILRINQGVLSGKSKQTIPFR